MAAAYREPGRDGGGAPVPEPGRPLPVAMLYRHCDPAELPIELVGELEDPPGPIGQDRTVRGGRIRRRDAPQGLQRLCPRSKRAGKHTTVEDLLWRASGNFCEGPSAAVRDQRSSLCKEKSGQNIPKNRCRTTIAEPIGENAGGTALYRGSGRLLKPRPGRPQRTWMARSGLAWW